MNDREQNAAAWLIYDTYELGLLPLFIVYSGFTGLNLMYVIFASLPAYAINLTKELRWQRKQANPRKTIETSILQLIAIILVAMAFYLFGVALNYVFG